MTLPEQDNELREAILLEFKNVHRLAPADYTENCTNIVMQLIAADRERVALEARIDELPFLKGMKETSASLLEDGSGDFVRVQDLDTRLGDWINELEMLTQQRKEK